MLSRIHGVHLAGGHINAPIWKLHPRSSEDFALRVILVSGNMAHKGFSITSARSGQGPSGPHNRRKSHSIFRALDLCSAVSATSSPRPFDEMADIHGTGLRSY